MFSFHSSFCNTSYIRTQHVQNSHIKFLVLVNVVLVNVLLILSKQNIWHFIHLHIFYLQLMSSATIAFNWYIKGSLQGLKEKCKNGIIFQGEKVKILRFTNDIVILTETKEILNE